MSQRKRIPAEKEHQIALLLDGQLDEAATGALLEEIAADPALRDAYMRHVEMHSMLQWCSGSVVKSGEYDIDPAAVAELLDEADHAARQQAMKEADELAQREAKADQLRRRLAELEAKRARRRPEPIEIPRSLAYLGSLALAAALVWMAFTIFTPDDLEIADAQQETPSVAEPPFVTLRDSVDARLYSVVKAGTRFKSSLIPYKSGARLTAGLYELRRGFLQMEFDDGATTILQSPVMVELKDASHVQLVHGKIVGQVPPSAIGFTVETSSAKIVDLGTEFGVEVHRRSEDVEVHVFDGEVELSQDQENREVDSIKLLKLTAGQAARVNSEEGKVVRKEAEDTRFVRALPTTIDYVGVDQGVGEYLRTTSTVKAFDADGDNVLGTAGFYYFNPNDLPKPPQLKYVGPFDNLMHIKPSFLDSRPGFTEGLKAGPGVYTVIAIPDYLDMDDPREPPGADVPNINSGVLCYDIDGSPADPEGSRGIFNPQGARPGSEVELCQIAIGEGLPESGFRLGVFTDNGDVLGTCPDSIRLEIGDVEGRVNVRHSDLNGDVYYFDIKRARPGDTITLYLTTSVGRFASIGGLTFDVLTEEGVEQ